MFLRQPLSLNQHPRLNRKTEIMRTKKKIAQAVANNAANFKQILDDIELILAESLKIPEPGERYLRLLNLQGDIDLYKRTVPQDINEQMGKISRSNSYAGVGVAAVGCSVMLLALSVPPAAAVFFWSSASVLYAGGIGVVLNAIKKNMNGYPDIQERKNDFLHAMNDFSDTVDTEQKRIMQEELPFLLSSPKILDLCKREPSIKDAFVSATLNEKKHPTIIRLDKPSYKKTTDQKKTP